MNLLRPVFHDRAFRPGLREMIAIHWRANLRMLRHPRDIAIFTVISMLPVLGLLGLAELFPAFLGSGPATPGNPMIELQSLLLRVIAVAVVFLALQHVAFMIAMDLTYIPHVRAAIRDRGVPLCPRCGHLLPPDAPDAACSECGATGSSATIRDSGRADATVAAAPNPDTEVPRR
jgi:hypothetical protein